MAATWMRSKLSKMERDRKLARTTTSFEYGTKPTTPTYDLSKVKRLAPGKARGLTTRTQRHASKTYGNWKGPVKSLLTPDVYAS